jgi:hypothetical protein
VTIISLAPPAVSEQTERPSMVSKGSTHAPTKLNPGLNRFPPERCGKDKTFEGQTEQIIFQPLAWQQVVSSANDFQLYWLKYYFNEMQSKYSPVMHRVLARIIFKRAKKHGTIA